MDDAVVTAQWAGKPLGGDEASVTTDNWQTALHSTLEPTWQHTPVATARGFSCGL